MVKEFGKAWNWNKKRIVKNKIQGNLNKILQNIFDTQNTVKTNIKKIQDIINNKKFIQTSLNIQQFKKYTDDYFATIKDETEKTKFLIENSINNLNTILPQSLFKSYLTEIKQLGEKTGKFIISSKSQDYNIVYRFIDQQSSIIFTMLENKYLQSTISENIYKDIYLSIIKEDSIEINPNASTMTVDTKLDDNSVTISNNKLNDSNTTNNKQVQQSKNSDILNKQLKDITHNFNDITYKLIFYFNITMDTGITKNFSQSKIIKKLLKNLNKTNNLKLSVNDMSKLSLIYFQMGMLNVFTLPTLPIK